MRERQAVWAREYLIESGLFLAALVSVLITAGIVGILAFEVWQFFREVSIVEFTTGTRWTPLFVRKHFGVLPLFAGTFLTSAIAMVMAVPMGLMSAILVSEYLRERERAWVKPALEVLAAVPTVVYGYFAFLIVTPFLQMFVPGLAGFNALGPGLVMGVMIMPIVSSLSEDAMHAVPTSLREGAYALGATRWQAAVSIVVPAALSGIISSFLLGASRAIGETMIVAVAAGMQANFTLNPLEAVQTATAYIVQVSLGDTPGGTIEYRTIFAVGASLFVATFGLNMAGHFLRNKFQEAYD